MTPSLVVLNAAELVTMGDGGRGEGAELGVIEDGALVVEGGRVAWSGTMKDYLGKTFGKPAKRIDARGRLVTPGFVDPHTHLAFAGSREDELERKIQGESYLSILEKGGGIQRTMRETRRATLKSLVDESRGRVRALVRNGVTTIEVKTGYGQDLATEVKLLGAIRRLSSQEGAELIPTFMGLHARPPEYPDAHEYVRFAISTLLPTIARLGPRFSDCFCEEGAFSMTDCEKYLRASRVLGMALKIHADEFSDSKGAALAARLGCVSADHLVASSNEGMEQIARRGVVATLLPGTSFFSGIAYAKAKTMMELGCEVALGTDLSPNSWVESPQFVMSLACSAMRMTPAQALRGCTVNAARAVGRPDLGRLVPGSKADLVIHGVPSYKFLAYRVGGSYVERVFKEGVEVLHARPG